MAAPVPAPTLAAESQEAEDAAAAEAAAAAEEAEEAGCPAMSRVLSDHNLLRSIFRHVAEKKELCHMGCVARAWHEAACAPEFWTTIDLRGQKITLDEVRAGALAVGCCWAAERGGALLGGRVRR